MQLINCRHCPGDMEPHELDYIRKTWERQNLINTLTNNQRECSHSKGYWVLFTYAKVHARVYTFCKRAWENSVGGGTR